MVQFDLQPGAVVTYYMTSPEGQRHHGWWRVLEGDAPHRCALAARARVRLAAPIRVGRKP